MSEMLSSAVLDSTGEVDLLHEISKVAADTEFRALPGDAVEAAKKSVLDTLGVILAASGVEPAMAPIVDLVRETGGRAESSILGFGGRAPAIMAAFANGAMAHCLDFDDQTPWGQHAASSIVPAVFAVAERYGSVTGADLVTGVAVGQDIFARLRRNVDWQKDWNFSTTMGVFAATAAACRVIRMPSDRIAAALSVASMQSSGVMETVVETGSDLHGIYAGFSAKGAVLSTLLSQKGTTGISTLFEGQHGILRTYFGGKYDRTNLLKGFGEEYLGGSTLYKYWPSVGTSHGHIHATIELMSENSLHVDDIREIRVFVGDHHALLCHPLDARRTPDTAVDAKFSLPFLVAVAALRGTVRVSDFDHTTRQDVDVRRTAGKVIPVPDSSLDWVYDMLPGRVEIVTYDDRVFGRVGTGLPGSPDAPLSWDQITSKFGDCAATAVKPPSNESILHAQRLARHLELQDDATELMRVLAST